MFPVSPVGLGKSGGQWEIRLPVIAFDDFFKGDSKVIT